MTPVPVLEGGRARGASWSLARPVALLAARPWDAGGHCAPRSRDARASTSLECAGYRRAGRVSPGRIAALHLGPTHAVPGPERVHQVREIPPSGLALH